MIYIGLAQNVTPLVTIVMSYFMTGEKLKKIDIGLIFVTFIGVTLISIGFGRVKEELQIDDDETEIDPNSE